MKLAIRLQNHGKKNHPYWWIVVAPNRKNIHGRFIQKLGIWNPRHNKHANRKILLNIPRIRYWMGNGAVPTFKVHKFLAIWGILPKQWHYERSAEEWAKLEKPQQQLTETQKAKRTRKMKRRERGQKDPRNYYRHESYALYRNKDKKIFLEKYKAQDKENEILRDILYQTQFDKISRLKDLSNEKGEYADKLKSLKEKLAQLRSQLASIRKEYQHANPVLQQKIIKKVNELSQQIRKVEIQGQVSGIYAKPEEQFEYMTQDRLDKQIDYALYTKKLEERMEEASQFQEYMKPVSFEQYALHLKKLLDLKDVDAINLAKQQFYVRGKMNSQILRGEIYRKTDDLPFFENERVLNGNPSELNNFLENPAAAEIYDPNFYQIMKKVALHPETTLPSSRSVHPQPDLFTYNPQQYYEPLGLDHAQCQVEALEPQEEVLKYYQKKKSRASQL